MVRRRGLSAATLALAALLGTGCISFEIQRRVLERPPAPSELDALEPGRSDLAEVLRRLGAPFRVVELGEGRAALAYGWLDSKAWGFGVSAPVGDFSASLDYDSSASRMRGILLTFGSDWVLEGWHEGALTDLLTNPSSVVQPPLLPAGQGPRPSAPSSGR